MAYNLVTKNGHNMYDMSSMMQKAIRRNNPNLAGYAAYELFGNFHTYMWKRLVVVSAEDCYGIMTKEVIAQMISATKAGRDMIRTLYLQRRRSRCYARRGRTGMPVM